MSIPISNTNPQVKLADSIRTEPRDNKVSHWFSARQLKIPAAVIGAATLGFIGYKFFSRSINCNRLNIGFFGELECEFKNGASYKGFVSAGKFSGQGCYTNPDEEKFCGLFQNSRFLYEGGSISTRTLDQCKLANLTACVATLRDKECETIGDAFSGELECEYDDGASYKGSVRAGKFSGQGCYTNPYDKAFCGTFKDNKFQHGTKFVDKWILDQCEPNSLTVCINAVLSRIY